MPKILVVNYTPRVDSNTRKLLDTFLETLPNDTDIDFLDLLDSPVPIHTAESINALLKRNFANLPLSQQELESVETADRFMQQLLDSDFIVLAFPMYNFSVPAAIKAWLDVVIQNGRTFTVTEEGTYAGLCGGKKALILMTAGGDYSEEPNKSMNFATPLMQVCLGFLHIESTAISAFGLNQYENQIDEIMTKAQQEIRDFSKCINTELLEK